MSIARPSAEKIADVYAGKPEALQQKIAQEPKGPTGLPLDLTKLMALNINLTETDALKRQSALDALQKMQQQSPTGELPTVAETIQQAALQKQMMGGAGQQPQQQGLQALAQQQGFGGAPKAQAAQPTQMPQQQPVMAARGGSIAQLMSNLGRHYAGGGIVAFTPGGGVEDAEQEDGGKLTLEEAKDIVRRMRQRTDMRPESMNISEEDVTSIPGLERSDLLKKAIERINRKERPMTPQEMEAKVKPVEKEREPSPPREPYSGPQQVTQRELAESYVQKRQAQREEDAKKPEDEMLKLVKQPFKAAGREISGLLKSLYGKKTPGEVPEQAGADQNAGEAIMQARENAQNAQDNRPVAIGNEAQRSLPSMRGEYPPAKGLPNLQTQKQNVKPAAASANAAPAGSGTAPAKPGIKDSPKVASSMDGMNEKLIKFFEASLDKTPESRRDEAIERFKRIMGEPDTAAQEKYIKQLEASRSRFAEPEDTYGRARQHLRDLANAGGRHWFQTGAKASANAEARKLSNQQKDMEVLKELMGESGKVADIKRGYKKEAFGFGEKAYDDAFKVGMDAAKELGLYGRDAAKYAHQSAENALDRTNRLQAASAPSGEERIFSQVAKDWLAKPENKGKSISDAYAAFKLAGSPSSANKGVMTRDQASDNVMKKIAYDSPIRTELMNEARDALKKVGIASPSASQITDYLIDRELGRANSTVNPAASSGKVPPPPPGFKPD